LRSSLSVAKKAVYSEVLTVLMVDLVSYTSTTAGSNREKISELQDILDGLSLPLFEKYGGYVVKKVGDAFLVTFRSPTNAVLCGVALQTRFNHHNSRSKQRPLRIRVALHTGEVVVRDNDVYGDAVNTTARVEGIAKAGHVVFTESTYLAMNKNEIPYTHLGAKKLKGLRRPVRLFRVQQKYDQILRERRAKKKRAQRAVGFFLKVLLLFFLATVGYFLLYFLAGRPLPF
jgi:adenylate cyclase